LLEAPVRAGLNWCAVHSVVMMFVVKSVVKLEQQTSAILGKIGACSVHVQKGSKPPVMVFLMVHSMSITLKPACLEGLRLYFD
jgi:hypothetical protein